jgi:SNF2 family DNA or RNA helicase
LKIGKAPFGDRYCLLTVPNLDTNKMEILNTLPSYKRWIGRDLLFQPTSASLGRLHKFFPDIKWDEDVQHHLDNYIKTLRTAEQIRKRKEDQTPEKDDFLFKTEPFEHQRKTFYLSRDQKVFALLMEQGTGKTKVVIDNSAYLYSKGEISALVVIAPNGVHRNWIREVDTHLPDWCEHQITYYRSGMNKKEIEAFESVRSSKDCLKIFTFNVEAFTSPKAVHWMEKILLSNDVMLVVDESTRIKTPGAKRTKLITKFGKQVKYKRILTGTPITKNAADVYAQFKFLDPQILGYDSFYSFRNQYCVMGGFEQRQIIAYKNLDELSRNVEGHSFRVLKKDCLDLPPKIYQRHFVEMSERQKKMYNTMKKGFIAELEGNVIEAPEAITRLLRLQQILCGWFPTENERVQPIDEKNPRIEALKDVLEGIESKVIIWARFRADIRAIERLLGDLAVSYHGGVDSDARELAIERFQKDPAIRYFIGTPQAGGTGLTLTAAEYAIYYSNSFDLEQRLQSEDRCHRIGTKNNVTYIDIECQKSIDSKIIKALRDKKNIADIITKDPISIFLEEEEA